VDRQLVGQNRDEDQVVDPQNDFQQDQRPQSRPCRRIDQPLHDVQNAPLKKIVGFKGKTLTDSRPSFQSQGPEGPL
jgi:hypothetical protein